MTKIVGERDRLGEVFVKTQLARHGARDLRHLKAVGQPGAVVVAFMKNEHLRFVGQAAKGGRMQYAVAVTLEWTARWALWLGVRAPAAWNCACRIKRGQACARGEVFAVVPIFQALLASCR